MRGSLSIPSISRLLGITAVIGFSISSTPMQAADLIRITAENYDSVVPQGKESDAIIGDWVLRNESIVAVVAQTTPGRKANMTVRGVAGCLIDYTRRNAPSDQLGCFYAAGGGYLFEQAEGVQVRADERDVALAQADTIQAKEIMLTVSGRSIGASDVTAEVTYTIRDGQDWISFETSVRNATKAPVDLVPECSIRCDGTLFRKSVDPSGMAFIADDSYFRQAYAIQLAGSPLSADNARATNIRSTAAAIQVAPGESTSWQGDIYCSQGAAGAMGWVNAMAAKVPRQNFTLRLQCPLGSVEHARVTLETDSRSGEVQQLGVIETDSRGTVRAELPAGAYVAKIQSHGRPDREHHFVIDSTDVSENLTLPVPSRIRAKISESAVGPVPAKVQFIGIDGTPMPDFGPDSAISSVKNVVYTASGLFERDIAPGRYRVIVSHGPEYDAEFATIEVKAEQLADLNVALRRTVDTRGWVSTEYHSHSSPSGDNVSHQTGRVLNLLAEHLEFAPCTEHNRVDTYADDLELLGSTSRMATCSGMELTGSPLPINHQNAFPIVRHPYQQDGGGPETDPNPVKQIERLAMWDNASEKVVQTNHPYIPQILGDRDLDGIPDDGFRGMLGWMDVIEVHPPEKIFLTPSPDAPIKDRYDNPIFYWMQLLNLGYRIPGVVNTDAHYNFHGSGWLRNYVYSSTDNPAEISVEEMIQSTQRGRIIMTTGPYLEVGLTQAGDGGRVYVSGDDVLVGDGSISLLVRVQCPNWFDVNRVQVFANGRPLDGYNFTRNTHPQLFSNSTVRFEHMIDLPKFDEDTHVIVATIGEGLTLGPVMGDERGELPPVAVSNPIFLDMDGSGFRANGDDLGIPFMVKVEE